MRKKRKMWKRLLITGGILMLILVTLGAGTYWKLNATFQKMYMPIKHVDDSGVTLNGKIPFSILIMGTDERDKEVGRSDTLILATVNQETKKTQLLSIPRDTAVNLPKHGQAKINAAYAYGGVDLASQATSTFLDDIPIHHYIKLNMDGFKALVDDAGGVDVINDKAGLTLKSQSSEGSKRIFPKGKIHLNGEDALAYVRIRKTDAAGDFGRQTRQQQVIVALAEKILKHGNLLKIPAILQDLGNNIETDFTLPDITKIYQHYRQALHHVENIQVKGSGGRAANGIWYYHVSPTERKQLSREIKANLK